MVHFTFNIQILIHLVNIVKSYSYIFNTIYILSKYQKLTKYSKEIYCCNLIILFFYAFTLRAGFFETLAKSLSSRRRIRFRAGRISSCDQSVLGRISSIYLRNQILNIFCIMKIFSQNFS